MKTKRMPKGWTLIGTNDLEFGSVETQQERIHREQKFRNAIHNIKSLTIEELKEESDRLFDARSVDNAQLLQAFKDKKLKSKALIKKAKALKQKTEKKVVEAKVATI